MEGNSGESFGRRPGQVSHVTGLHSLHLIAPPLLWAALIFYLSSRPVPEPIVSFSISDKLLHVFAYAVLGFLVGRWLASISNHSQWKIISVAVFITAIFGVTDEFHQLFVPSRSSDVMDAFADFVGALCGAPLGVWATLIWSRIFRSDSAIRY